MLKKFIYLYIKFFYFLLFLVCCLACWKKEPNGLPPAEEKKFPKSSSSAKALNPLAPLPFPPILKNLKLLKLLPGPDSVLKKVSPPFPPKNILNISFGSPPEKCIFTPGPSGPAEATSGLSGSIP